MTLHPHNEAVLRDRFPGVLRLLRNTEASIGNDSMVESLSFSGCATPKSGTCYAVCGFGSGKKIKEFVAHADSFTYFFIAEADIAALRSVLSTYDYSLLLKDHRVILACGECNESFFSEIYRWNLNIISDAEPLINDQLFSLFSEYYKTFLSAFAQFFGNVHRLQKTASVDSKLWLEKTITNLPRVIKAPDVAVMSNLFKGLPLILVSAGPSLDLSYDFLKKARAHSVIVAVNSAYRCMIKNGIKPHITLAADPRESTYKGYEGVDIDDVYLVAPYHVNEKVIKAFEGRTFTWSNANILVNYIRKNLGLRASTPVAELGTVSSAIASLATLWGCSKVYLVGQDFSVNPNGQTHSKYSFYTDTRYPDIDFKKCRKLSGNQLHEVLVEEKLFIYLKLFIQLIADSPHIEYINTSPLGAKIEGASYEDFSRALFSIKAFNSDRVQEDVCSACVYEKNLKLCDRFSSLAEYFKKVLTTALSGAILSTTLYQRYSRGKMKYDPGMQDAFRYAEKVNHLVQSYPEESNILIECASRKELNEYLNYCRDFKPINEHLDALGKNAQYFWALAEGSLFLTSRLKEFK